MSTNTDNGLTKLSSCDRPRRSSIVAALALGALVGCSSGADGDSGRGGSSGQAGTNGGAGNGAAGTTGQAGTPGIAGSSGGAPGAGGQPGLGGAVAGNGGATGGSGPGGGAAGNGTAGGGVAGRGGAGATGGSAGHGGGAAGGSAGPSPNFSFFLISVGAVRALSGNQDGFGGDLRYGETGAGAGLRGADKICAAAAERAWPGTGSKAWRAFLSTSTVNAKDRVGTGPWYDAAGRRVASDLTQLLMDRPGDADQVIKNDLPNEYGIPNHGDGAPGCSGNKCPDNHQTLTGSKPDGTVWTGSLSGMSITTADATCNDWTNKEATGRPMCGHSWPRQGSGTNWISSYYDGGCAPCARLEEAGGVTSACVGSAGGYGGFYCFVTNSP